MKKLLLLSSVAISILGCKGTALSGAVKDKDIDSAANAFEKSDEDPKSNSPSISDTDETLDPSTEILAPPPAQAPVVIAGALLTCIPSAAAHGADCELKKGVTLFDFPITKAYVIKSVDLVWVETTYQRTAVGKVHVNLPENLSGSYAIGFTTDADETVASWAIPPTDPARNLVKDGSFESYTKTTVGSSFVENKADKAWQAILPANASCTIAYMEIVVGEDYYTAPNGQKYVDLNSTCDIANNLQNNDVILTQNTASLPGHLYEMFFNGSRNPKSTVSNGLIGKFGGKNVANISYGLNTPWIESHYLIGNSAENGKLEFQDRLPDGQGNGPLLDNVRLYDLGVGPK